MPKRKLEVLSYPHPILKKVAEPVSEVTDEIRTLLDDMLETMYQESGAALAAPQVGISKRLFVMDIDETQEYEKPNVFCMVNPEIIWRSPETEIRTEGCLSFPGIALDIERHLEVKVRYLDREGNSQELHARSWVAWCIQHEFDHLDGILFIDRVSRVRRTIAFRKMDRAHKNLARKGQ